MQKQDLKLLKNISAEHAIEPSKRSTELIFMAAAEQARKSTKRQASTASSQHAKGLTGTDFVQLMSSAALSVLFTLGVFLTLHQVLAPSAFESTTAGEPAPALRFKPTPIDPSKQGQLNIVSIPKPHRQEYAPVGQLHNLRALSEASIDLLVEHQIRVSEGESIASKRLIEEALRDITAYVRTGRINDARSRYELLKVTCESCLLPASLEALAYLTSPVNGNG